MWAKWCCKVRQGGLNDVVWRALTTRSTVNIIYTWHISATLKPEHYLKLASASLLGIVPVRNLGQDVQYGTDINIKNAERDLMGFPAFKEGEMTAKTRLYNKMQTYCSHSDGKSGLFIGDCEALDMLIHSYESTHTQHIISIWQHTLYFL